MLINPRVLGVFPAAVLLISTVMAEPFVETPQITIEPDFCSLYPITLEDTTFEDASNGEQFPALSLGTGPGNYNWLSWSGTNNAPSQEARLIPPGNSSTYVNPNDGLDNQINVGDWVQGTPGVKNSNGIRTQMDALINQHIIIPLYSSYEGSGTNLNYQVSKFAVVKLLDYKLNGKGYVSLEYVRHTRCYNNRPVANDQIIEVLEDHTIDIRLLYSDDDSDQLAVSEHSNTQFGSLTVNGLALTAHYSPNQNYYGEDSFVFTLHDGEQLSNQAQVRIRVIPVNDAPVAVNQTVTGLEDSLIKLTFDASDIDSSQLTFEPSLNNQIGQILEENGAYFYQPPANFSGDIALTYQAYDGELYSNVADLLVRVLPVNDSPVALGLTLDVEQGASVQFLPEVTDIDSDSYVLETVSHPETGTLVINGNQVIYTADSNFEGQVSWQYRANDLAIGEFDEGTNLSNTATVTLNVLKINEPPVITSSAIELTDENSPYQYQVIAEDPNERDVLSYELSFAPHNMSIDSLTGRINWTPDSSWVQSVPDFNKQCYVVPTGSAKVYEEGDEDNALTYVAPLFQQVKRALEHASDYTGERTVAWDRKEKCLGCHIQTQTLLGLQASLGKADVDLNSAEFLLEELLSSQQSDGSIRQSHPQYSKTQTAFALWSLSYVTDFERTLEKRGRAQRFMMDRQSTNGDQIYWSQDHSSGWMRDYDSITSVIALSGARFIKDLKKIDSPTSELQNYADAFQDNVDKIVNFELARAFGNDNETLWLAFRQIALAELRPLVSDATRLVEIDNAINWLDNTLRSRQLPVGGWSRYSYGSSADPLTSAWVGLALNYLDPALTDSAVINNIKYLLESQSANGTWVTTSGLFNTHLATTSLVMAYLPVALEHLGNPDVYAGTIHLVEGESGSHQLTAKISNRGLADITSELLIQFFNGEGENELLGTTTLNRLLSGEQATASINVEDSALTDHVYVTITSASDADECEITNNKTHAALVRVKASDPDEEFDTQVFTLNVLDVNEAPVIISDAPLTHQGGQGLVYQVQVADNDEGDGHQFTLMNAPDNVYIDQNTGKLTAAPGTLAPGDYTVVVQVTDLRGETDTQTITFTVFANEPPQIVSIAVSEGLENGGYEYDVDAIDPNNDELEYALEIFPQGSWINKNSGLLNWVGRSEFVEPTTTANEFCVGSVAADMGKVELVEVMRWEPSKAPQPSYNQVMMAPIVLPLMDTNNDSQVDVLDEKAIVFSTFTGGSYNRAGFLRAISAKTGETLWTSDSSLQVLPESSIAAADIDLDGFPEIVVPKSGGGFHVLEHDGSLKWTASTPSTIRWGGASIADIDANGSPEIIMGLEVYSADGNLMWRDPVGSIGNGPGPLSFAADINLDGFQEIISGGHVYDYQGNQLWSVGDGLSAIANFDDDDYAEIVRVAAGTVQVFNHDGSAFWASRVNIPGGGSGGAPTIADFDGDGEVEIGVAGANNYVAFDTDGSILWQSPTRDASSNVTGSSVFDFNGDGRAEIVYADEYYLRVYDGPTGEIIHESSNTSGTTYELPVIADVDDDGHAEIVAISNSYAFGGYTGVRVLEAANDDWAPTRSIWNQHAYNINNINDDLTVPANPVKSWLTHNTFRLNTFPDRPALGMADVTVHNIRFIESTNTITADIVNRGLAPVVQPLTVTFTHEHHWTGDTALGTATINALAVGESQTITLPVSDVSVLEQTIRVTVETAANTQECITDNNTARAVMMKASVYDEAGESDMQLFAASIANENDAPAILSSSSSTVAKDSPFNATVEVADIDVGDDHRFELIDAPAGLEIDEFSGVMSSQGLPLGVYTFVIRATDLAGRYDEQTHLLTVVEPDNAAPEITSVPPTSVTLGETYEYPVMASDADGDAIQFFMSRTQAGVSIDTDTGLIQWTPAQNQVGLKSLEVSVVDEQGAITKQYFLVDVIEPDLTNQAPIITSVPSGVVVAGQEFSYQVVATDPDADPLTFRVSSDIAAIAIDPQGLLTWLPATELVGQAIVVEVIVEDGRGGMASQKMTLPVNDSANNPPMITSTPALSVFAGDAYQYVITAEDADGDAVRFELLEKPNGMKLSNNQIDWAPSSAQAGNVYNVVIKATDARGAASTQTFGIAVNEQLPPNTAPSILSTPTSPSFVGEEYQYAVIASDPENDPLTYSVTPALAGLAIDNNGLLTWTPTADQLGLYQIVVRVEDGRAWATQTYTLEVVETQTPDENGNTNAAPEITSTPRTQAVADVEYQYQVTAIDADGDALIYEAMTLPDNATFTTDGLLTWTPTQAQVGIEDIVLSVSDGNIRAIQSYSIAVFTDFLPIDAFLNVTPQNPDFGDLVDIQVFANGGRDTLVKTLTVNGVEHTLDEYGRTAVLANTYGVNDVVATVTDGTDTVTETSWFSVVDPNDTAAPVVSIQSPTDGSVIAAPTEVIGTVNDANLRQWELILKEKGSAPTEYQVIATGNTNVDNAFVGTLDPTMLNNGQYVLFLVAEDANGLEQQAAVTVVVEGDFKVGNFSVTFEDLNIPVAGVPIRVTRTYDSRSRHERLDFGYGWSVGYQDVKVQESRTPGKFWALNQYSGAFGIIPNFCVEPEGAPIVTVTLPDGSVERFEAAVTPRCNTALPITDVSLVFNAMGDTQSKLVALNDTSAKLIQGTLVETGYFSSPVNPNRYKLTTQAGYEYYIHQENGVEKIIDPNGHTLTFSANGILHSSGKSIKFVRNAYGQIEQIIDPAGNVLEYKYNVNGDLTNALDAVAVNEGAEGSRYTYLGTTHGLDEMFDPLGRRVIRNVYDDTGRLDYQEDSNGNIISFDHDLEGRISTVTDREGRTKVFAYDEEGNVLNEIQKAQGIVYSDDIESEYAYDANGNQISSAIGGAEFATTASFDAKNNQTEATNALGHTVYYRDYNEKGQEGEIEDELGRVHNMHYDIIGNLYLIEGPEYVDPDTGETKRHKASNTINSRGLVTSSTDMKGMKTTFTYYPKGHAWEDQKQTESTELGGTTTYTYDDSLNVKTEMRTRTVAGSVVEETIEYEYDSQNRVIKTIYHDGSYSQTVYDLAGNAVEERDRFGVWTEHEFDAYGRTIETRYADGTAESWEYTAEGNLETHTSRSGIETYYEYDDFGRQWKVYNRTEEMATGQPSYTETQYTPQGWVQYEWDAERNLTEYEYNVAGQRTKVISHDGEGNTFEHSFTYYDNGELHTETDANGHTTTYELNEQDLRVKTIYHDGTDIEAKYDAMGTRTHAIDQNNRSTRFGYDILGRLIEVQPEVQVSVDGFMMDVPTTRYTYDEVGNKLTQTDAKNNTTTWTYDGFGRTTSRKLPEGQTETTEYSTQACTTSAFTGVGDDVCQVVTHTDFNGQSTITVMDQMGRTERIDFHDGSFKAYTYYTGGQVKTVTTEFGTVSYTYDSAERLATETQIDGTVLSYQYDRMGNKTQLTVNHKGEETITRYTYDGLNRLSTVIDATGTTTYSYDKVGNLDTVTAPNGNVTDYDYTSVNQLWQLTITNASNETLSHYVYELDATGHRELITEHHSGRVIDNVYDNLYRLTGENITDAINGNYHASYEYDLVGNRTYETVDGVQTAYSYNANDWLLQTGGTTFGYDDNGNTVTETLDGVTTTYTYNSQNQMVETNSNGVITQYGYNPSGIRSQKVENAGTAEEVTIDYLVEENRDYAQVLQETENGDITVSYQYGHDLISQTRNSGVSFYQYDGLGSVRQLTNESGSVSDSYVYEAFGDLENQTGSTENSYRYTGEQYDANLGFYYLRARYMDAGTGRFFSQDTWMGRNHDPITLHKYAYANVNPANMVDPSGYMSVGLAGMSINLNISGSLRTVNVAFARRYVRKVFSTIAGNMSRRAIRREIRKCQRRDKGCLLNIPVLIYGGDIPSLTQHVEDAQFGRGSNLVPSGFLLHYKDRTGNRSWYNKAMECSPVKKTLAMRRLGSTNVQCDEFPMYKTKQGGHRNHPGRVSLRYVDGDDNMQAGRVYGGLVGSSGLRNLKDKKFLVFASDEFPISLGLPLNRWYR